MSHEIEVIHEETFNSVWTPQRFANDSSHPEVVVYSQM